MKLIHVTDTHLVAAGGRLYGLDPRQRLDACIANINAHHADAALCLVTGDLTHWGQPEAYEQLREALAALRVPVRLLLGNHDDRKNFRAAFPDAAEDQNGFVQWMETTPAGSLICLDTNEPGVSWGVLCRRRLDWLRARLEVAAQPIYLFLHHPPFPVGIRKMDTISLRSAHEFAAVVRPFRAGIRHMFFGHLHRPICGSWMGIPFSTMRGTNHQVALNFEIDGVVPGSLEPPQYAIVLIDGETVVVHFHDYLDETATFNL